MSNLFTSRLIYDIESEIESNKSPLEIEARLRNLTEKQIGLLRDYAEKSNMKRSDSFTIDYYVDNKRITQEDDKYYFIIKKEIFRKILFSPPKDIKISISTESEKKPAKEPKNFSRKRIKDRTSYEDDNLRLDITKVDDNGVLRTEVELEVIDSQKFDKDKFFPAIINIYDQMKDMDTELISYLNEKLLQKISDNEKDIYSILSRARDLLIRDMTKQGLLNNYTIALKADGVQKMMIFKGAKTFLFYPNQGFLYLADYKNPSWDNCVLMGEWVEKSRHQYEEYDYLFLPFDILVYQDRDVRRDNYLKRLSYLTSFYDNTFANTHLLKKPYLSPGKDIVSFYSACRQILDLEKEVKFSTDGIIFTPIDSPYLTLGQKLPQKGENKQRILSKFPDVCKYKSPENLTIDFLVKSDGLYIKEGKFKGTKRYPFDKKNYQVEDKYLNKIVEFEPNLSGRDIVYYPRAIRTDKKFPNRLKQSLDIWSLVHNPIKIDTIRGESVQLMRRYHNKIKEELLSRAKGMVIDIGAGAGGVFDKYIANPDIGKVLSIEPNKEFAEEFERRRKNLKKPDQFKLLLSGGEESDRIIDAAKDFFPSNFGDNDLIICFHISLSFFWKNKEMLKALAETISKIESFYKQNMGRGEVKILYLTIEGSRVENLFQQYGNMVKLNDIELRKISDNEVYIDIADSITVHDQTEYLVRLDELWRLTGFQPYFQEEADNRDINGFMLSQPELTYSRLFVYGIAERKNMTQDLVTEITSECLPVDEKRSFKSEFGLLAKGDDERAKIKDNIYRIATMKTSGKIYHTLLKLFSLTYRKSDVRERHRRAEKLKKELRGETNLEKLSKRLDIGIKIINSTIFYNPGKEKNIVLYQCPRGDFEPVIRSGIKEDYFFNKNDDILE
jgi:hypothetical protein